MKLDVWINEDSQTYYTKGHVDTIEFKKAVKKEEIASFGENRFENTSVEHGWFKAVPDNSGNYRCMYHPSKEGVRGSFKATTTTIY